MVAQTQSAIPPEPFRWKLFIFVMFVMGSITTAAIILTLMAMPNRAGIHAPPPQPISMVISPISDHPNPACVL